MQMFKFFKKPRKVNSSINLFLPYTLDPQAYARFDNFSSALRQAGVAKSEIDTYEKQPAFHVAALAYWQYKGSPLEILDFYMNFYMNKE